MLTVGTILLSITLKTIKNESEAARQQGKADSRWSKMIYNHSDILLGYFQNKFLKSSW